MEFQLAIKGANDPFLILFQKMLDYVVGDVDVVAPEVGVEVVEMGGEGHKTKICTLALLPKIEYYEINQL